MVEAVDAFLAALTSIHDRSSPLARTGDMDGHSASGPPGRISALSFSALGTGLGLVAGVGELAVVAAQRLAGRDFLMRSRDAIWMIPAVDAALLGLAGIVAWVSTGHPADA